ncbi:type V toxin-antitoxin system endoribonuclease antitoxin GhoS [Erwinia sorbitola]|uniref:Type V toxin-antitoxin system endoribonuclease antitoxin GhoS n=1 Tax=Erwinia sorbitola TaxID=2681984 RepID=A0A6I6ES66_9GAMM|nr:type V toxin-antitoxin system endoribonuclease antitoxin GhoS [Erwinia sorbitola]MTD26121.1 type V toxin-antitoxin system endoribonuclease antitoxin GhoS [Erwinia sorbitola]QGU87342.1 type V toxin-antitoxin system endoribonuclease antitoxin GhoS [Erwinia sorbitola]
MSNHGINQYVVTFRYNEKGLSEVLELSSALINSGFSATLKDDNGLPYELGTNNFGYIGALSEEEIHQQAVGIGEQVLGEAPEIEIQPWDTFRRNTG